MITLAYLADKASYDADEFGDTGAISAVESITKCHAVIEQMPRYLLGSLVLEEDIVLVATHYFGWILYQQADDFMPDVRSYVKKIKSREHFKMANIGKEALNNRINRISAEALLWLDVDPDVEFNFHAKPEVLDIFDYQPAVIMEQWREILKHPEYLPYAEIGMTDIDLIAKSAKANVDPQLSFVLN